MTQPSHPPLRKNPLQRTRLPLLPPTRRSRRAHDLTWAAAEGRFALHACESCGTYSYPPREACPACLSDQLALHDAPDGGELLSATEAQVPADNYFRERAPWGVGLVRLDCGPTVLCFLNPQCKPRSAVHLRLRLDKAGQAVFYAFPASEGRAMSERELAEDPQWRELGADPQHRRILITDGRNPVLMPLVTTLKQAGAREVIVGLSESWKPFAHSDALAAMDKVTVVPLDLTNERSVSDTARDHAAKIEILINTADYLRPGALFGGSSMNAAREAMERLYFGQLRLAEAFAPVMIARGADKGIGAAAWVNLLSIYAEAHDPAYATYAGAQAAAVALSHSLRAKLAKGGIRLANVFAGPTDSEWYQTESQPKLAHSSIAAALVDALKHGTEETYVGDVARDLHQRKRHNPKALERELAAGLER